MSDLQNRPRLEPRQLPSIHDNPVIEFWKGWWHGVAIGAITTAGAAVIAWKAVL